MRDVHGLLETIAQIYTVPGDPGRWTEVLQRIGHRVDAHAGGYLLIDAMSHNTAVGGQWGFTDAHRLAYEGMQGAAKDVRFKYTHRLIPGRVMFDFEHVPDRVEYEASEWIQHERATLGIYWYMVALASQHGLWHDIVTINRREERGPYREDERADLQAMLPHLARAAELHRTLALLEDRYGAVLAVLDKLLVGAVILDHRQRVVVANRSARRACEESGALQITADGYLRARQPEKDARLQALLEATAATVGARGRNAGGSIPLANRSSPGGLLAEVLPLRDDGFSDGDHLRGSVVFVMDPYQARDMPLEWLVGIFGLTRAERDVAARLINGSDTRAIAESQGKSVETVRTQLKSVFAKTGTRSQLELLRLAFKATPQIEADSEHRPTNR